MADRCWVIGVGGIGTWVLPAIIKEARFNEAFPKHIILVDGDKVDDGNFKRQDFDASALNTFKAEAKLEDIKHLIDGTGVEVDSICEYIDDAWVEEHFEDGDMILCCVDNHPTRRVLQDKASDMNNVIFISAGNEKTTGNVQTFLKENGTIKSPSIYEAHPEIEESDDAHNPANMSCEQRAALPGGIQIFTINFFMAAVILMHIYSLTSDDARPLKETFVDITTGNMKSEYYGV